MWSEKMEGHPQPPPPQSPISPVMLTYPPHGVLRQDSCGFSTVELGHCTRQEHHPAQPLSRSDSIRTSVRDNPRPILTRHISQSREYIMEDEERMYRELRAYIKKQNLFILLVCLVLIAAGFILLFLTPMPGRTYTGQSVGLSPYCVPCQSLTLSVDPMDDAATMGLFDTQTELDGTVICCAHNHTQLDTLLSLVSTRTSFLVFSFDSQTGSPSYQQMEKYHQMSSPCASGNKNVLHSDINCC